MLRYDLTRLPFLKTLLRSRWPQFLLSVIALLGFLLAILSGLVGSPVGSRNFGIIFVWIAWWAILMLVAVPFFGRGWCSICPIPLPGEWLQRGALLKPGEKGGLGLGRRWPNRWRNIWLQNGSFALVALFSAVILTQPRATGIVLAAFLFVAVGTSLIFERRAFCRYLCPVGGFIGLYSQAAPVEVRVKDSAVCAAHTEKTCYTGSAEGFGCPWQVYPAGLVKNTYCGTCMECLRTCPQDNIAINLRLPGTDLAVERGRKLDEAYKAFIMLGSALIYAAVLLGPWGSLKAAAFQVGTLSWLGYALAFVLVVFGLLPGLFYLAVLAGKHLSGDRLQNRRAFISYSYALIPLGLAAWIAFSLAFVFTNLSYIGPAISDPFGWGWNLMGAADQSWTPYLTQALPALQIVVLLGGLIWTTVVARRIATQQSSTSRTDLQALPVATFACAITLSMLGLLIG